MCLFTFLSLVFSNDALLAHPQNVLWCCWPLLFDIFTSSYDTVHEDGLQDLPIKSLARPGCLVVLWVTNNERLEEYSLHTLFPAWGLSAVARWHWIKVAGICHCIRSVCSFVRYKQRKVFCFVLTGSAQILCHLNRTTFFLKTNLKKQNSDLFDLQNENVLWNWYGSVLLNGGSH